MGHKTPLEWLPSARAQGFDISLKSAPDLRRLDASGCQKGLADESTLRLVLIVLNRHRLIADRNGTNVYF
jgi:hypothetical protein